MTMARRWAWAAPLFVLSCGYHAVRGGANGGNGQGLHVVLARSLVADAVASDEVVSGAREELAREGVLVPGDGYPRVEIEVLRADESSDAVASPSSAIGSGAGGAPRARATEVGFVARAWLVRSAGAAPERDTGDVRAIDLAASDVSAALADPRADLFHHEDALRAVARRLGGRLASRLLGHPAASDEAPGRER
jgi:hypothetical protein